MINLDRVARVPLWSGSAMLGLKISVLLVACLWGGVAEGSYDEEERPLTPVELDAREKRKRARNKAAKEQQGLLGQAKQAVQALFA